MPDSDMFKRLAAEGYVVLEGKKLYFLTEAENSPFRT